MTPNDDIFAIGICDFTIFPDKEDIQINLNGVTMIEMFHKPSICYKKKQF